MKFAATLVAVSAAAVSAQVTFDNTTNTFVCAGAAANANFCAGDSLATNIIIRCTNGRGQPGNCNDNLAGYPPRGVQPALCYQSSEVAGDAACSKNCIVYGANTTFTLPGCVPTYTDSTTLPTSTGIVPPPTNGTTTISPPPITTVTTATLPNGDVTSITVVNPPTNTPIGPTATTDGSGPIFTGAAVRNVVGGAVGVVGVVAALVL